MILNLEQKARTITKVLTKQIPQISREVLQTSQRYYSLFHGNVVKNGPADKENAMNEQKDLCFVTQKRFPPGTPDYREI